MKKVSQVILDIYDQWRNDRTYSWGVQ